MDDREGDRPVAVRAAAFARPSRWRRRPRRVVRYDALGADGRVRLDVDLGDALGPGYPADLSPVRRAIHDACPEDGTGRWIDRAGAVVDGPGPPSSSDPRARGGRPQRYRPPTDEPAAAVPRTWRLGVGVLGLATGVPLVSGLLGDGVAGPVGVVLCLTGVATLAGLRGGG
jgi:hypothetical protein